MSSLEILNFDIIEEDFFKVFASLYILQSILGSVRISYRHRFVCGTSLWQKCYALFTTVVSFYSMYHVTYGIEKFNTTKEMVVFLHLQFFSMVFMCSYIVLNNTFIQTTCNASIYVTLQNIDRCLKMTGKEEHYGKLAKRNFISCLLTVAFYIIWFICLCVPLIRLLCYYDMLVTFLAFIYLSIEDFEILAFSSILNFLYTRVEFINSMMEERVKIKCSIVVHDVSDYNEKQFFHRLSEAYRELAEAFNLFQKLYRLYVFVVMVYTFIMILSIIARIITQYKYFSTITASAQLLFMVSRICIRPFYMSVACEMFNNQINRTKDNCYSLLKCSYHETIRKHIKSVLRVIKVRMQPFSVYGMFTLDARLPLRLLALTTTYTVVLLQFEFL